MKTKALIVLLLMAFAIHSFAQDSIQKKKSFEMKTLLKPEKKSFCYYGGLSAGVTILFMPEYGSQKTKVITVSLGGNIAWLASRSLGIGVAFSALGDYDWWYAGGLYIEPFVKPKSRVHVSFPTVLGFGYGNEKTEADSYVGNYVRVSNGYLYGESGIQVEFDPWKYMRLGLGAKFHGVAGINTKYDFQKKNNLSGFSIFLAMKFGKFHTPDSKTVNFNSSNSSKPLCKKNIPINGSVWTGYTNNRVNDRLNNHMVAAVVYGANITYSLWHRLGVGVSFTRFSNKFSSSWFGIHESARLVYLEGYYGGLFIEPRLFAKYPVHLSFPITIGMGNLTSHNYVAQGSMHDIYYTLHRVKEKYSFGILEPGAEIELNLLKFMRLGVGAKYRFTSDINFDSSENYVMANIYKPSVLRRFTINVSLKFGKF